MKNNESVEMYLETIYVLSKKNNNVKSIDIANELNYSRASVSKAIKILLQKEYITLDEKKNIKLSAGGYQIAYKIYDRHTTLTKFLEEIGVSKDVAEDDACKMEHVISNETLQAIKMHFNK